MTNTHSLPYRLLAPGPVPIPSSVLEALSRPAIHHRTPEFSKILGECFEGLKTVFETKDTVLIQAATGSGVMESALVNTINPGDEVLCLVGGKFGERWADMAETYQAKVVRLNGAWGEAFDLNKYESLIKTLPNLKAVLTQACETSTATAFPVREISEITKRHTQALVMVDAITAMGCMELPMDKWGLDVVVAGSQKAFMLPTGMGFIGISEEAKKRSLSNKTSKYYFDWQSEFKVYPKTTHFSTPNSMVIALREVLKIIQKAGLNTVLNRCRNLQETTKLGCDLLGLKLFSKSPSFSVTAISLPENIEGEKLRDWLEKEKNITVMGGQDQLKNKVLRIGHMGAITNEDMLAFFEALAEGLKITPPKDLAQRLNSSLSKSSEYFL